jgi:hypothetical protein
LACVAATTSTRAATTIQDQPMTRILFGFESVIIERKLLVVED